MAGDSPAVGAHVADAAGELAVQPVDCSQNVAAKQTAARSRFQHSEAGGFFQQLPHLEELDCQKGPEGRMDRRTGVEISRCPDAIVRGVVTASGIVEAQLHELCEGNWANLSNAAANF